MLIDTRERDRRLNSDRNLLNLLKKRTKTVESAKDLALEKLMESLGVIDVIECDAKDASAIARNLATVYEKLSPKENPQTNVSFIVYAPQQRREEDFKVVEITPHA